MKRESILFVVIIVLFIALSVTLAMMFEKATPPFDYGTIIIPTVDIYRSCDTRVAIGTRGDPHTIFYCIGSACNLPMEEQPTHTFDKMIAHDLPFHIICLGRNEYKVTVRFEDGTIMQSTSLFLNWQPTKGAR